MNALCRDYEDGKILDMLDDKQINYLSLTVFNNNNPIISYCNNSAWFGCYKDEYTKDNPPPVQKYIFSSKFNVLVWDSISLDKQSKDFIQKRNEITSVRTNVSLIYKKSEKLAVLTLGSKMSEKYLIDFLSNDVKCLYFIVNNIFNGII